MPSEIEPMKAALAEYLPRGEDWLFEVKWDGVRAIAFVDREEVRLQSRTGHRCERQYPELSTIHHQLAAEQVVLDGEIAVLDSKGVSQFHLIQPRIANTDPNSVAHLARSTPVVYFVFDLLYLDGYDLRGVALRDRKAMLHEVVTPGGVLRISEAFPGAGAEMLEAARENGLEGLLAKHAGSRYESRRSRDWLKLKIVNEQEFVIGGFTVPQGDRSHFGALILGVYEAGKLRWVGNVGTGFNQRSLADLYSRLSPLVIRECPFAERPKPDRGMTWVKPELVCQVKYANWTQEDHLRAPVYLGLRDDARPREVARETAAPPDAVAVEADAEPNSEPVRDLLPPEAKEAKMEIDGRPLKFTHLDKIYYPADGVTKRDVLNYYDAVAGLILPHLKD
ncbi:MAG TPA: non-homologous end-joining DNA ligase, partial [Candidatus Sulfopaludibacter sp.]|nr:non-homologous end-joining DNA ligase [Candidatus Sulfopaludibacter sp.]